MAGAAAVAAFMVGGAASAPKPPTVLASFTTPGVYSFTVPAKVRSITFDVFGGEGGRAVTAGSPGTIVGNGGPGGHARVTLTVAAGQTFQIVVGARGGNSSGTTPGAGGFNGGGSGDTGGTYGGSNRPTTVFLGGAGGGGASDVRAGTCAALQTCGLADRVIVAGGGGGAGGDPDASSTGGTGGGLTGGTGFGDGAGRGGTQLAAGTCLFPGGTNPQTSGSLGQGGSGNGASGGGGGGLYGGAGGCTSGIPPSDGQGSAGGGGSGFLPSSAKKASFPSDLSNTNGSVTITEG
jgi:hypothetical protein